jgi:hypothetical protein
MRDRLGRAVLAASALGYPLTLLAVRRFGRRGALVAEAVCGGLLVRDAAMLRMGTARRLRRGPAALLWLETAAAAAAVATGLRPLFPADGVQAATDRPPDRAGVARRAAVGALFGLHTVRFWIYLRPDRGLRR